MTWHLWLIWSVGGPVNWPFAQYLDAKRGGMKEDDTFLWGAQWHGGIRFQKDCRKIFSEHAEAWNWSKKCIPPPWTRFHRAQYTAHIEKHIINQRFHSFIVASPLSNPVKCILSMLEAAMKRGRDWQLLDSSRFNRGSGWSFLISICP